MQEPKAFVLTADEERRFRMRIDTDTTSGCHIWLGQPDQDGYGQFAANGRNLRAHRVAYYLAHGVVPGDTLNHLCRKRHCVNPAHLEPATQKEQVHYSVNGVAKLNSAKSHCPRGHAYDMVKPQTGERMCSICRRDQSRHKPTGNPVGRPTGSTVAFCKRGHPRSGDNLGGPTPSGQYYCKACLAARNATNNAKRAEARRILREGN